MNVLVDSSVWGDYFRGSENSGVLDLLMANILPLSLLKESA